MKKRGEGGEEREGEEEKSLGWRWGELKGGLVVSMAGLFLVFT